MSTIALKVLELVKSLPPAEQEVISAELARSARGSSYSGHQFQRLSDGTYYSPEGIPDDDPFFRIMEEQDAERSRDPGPPAPELE